MGWIPNKEKIIDEAQRYDDLKFFDKSKNILTIFILITSSLSIFFIGSFNIEWVSIIIGLVLAGFIYFNHRWAMVVFALMYSADKISFISMGATPVPQIIFGAIALICSYSAFRVASQLKKQNKKI